MGKFDGILITTDWDGTLFFNGDISKENIDAINYFMANGGKFTVCSGRYYKFLEQYRNKINPNTYFLCYNGALIINPDTKEVLHEGFCDDYIFKIVDKLLCSELDFLNVNFYDDKNPEPIQLTIEEFKKTRESYEKRNLYKILFRFPSVDMALKAKKILSEFDMRGYIAVRSWEISLEILKEENAKGYAIRRLKKALGAKTVVAVGDFENDIEMLKAADIGYAVENATDDLKAVADRLTVHAKDSALAEIISELEAEMQG